MKRLFMVVDSGNVVVRNSKGPLFFKKKAAAKKCRDMHKGSRVSYGPDHWKRGGKLHD